MRFHPILSLILIDLPFDSPAVWLVNTIHGSKPSYFLPIETFSGIIDQLSLNSLALYVIMSTIEPVEFINLMVSDVSSREMLVVL